MAGRRKRGDGGFWDFVKDPSIRKRMVAAARSRDTERLEPSDPETIRSAVARLLVRKPDHDEYQVLARLGPIVVPALVEALHDPRFHKHSYGSSVLDGSALRVVLELLEPYGPPEAAAPLAPLVRHTNRQVRNEAALALGNIGTEDCLEPLTAALSDEDEYVRSYALMGLRRGIKAGRAARGLLDPIFGPVARLLQDPEGFTVCDEAALALFEIDRARATRTLLDGNVLSRSTRYVHKLIEAALEKSVPIPPARLLDLLRDLRPDVLIYPNNYSYGSALFALAVSGHPKAEGLIREAMAWNDDVLARRASEALALLYGVSDPFGVVANRYDRDGFDALTAPQKHYFCASVFRDQVNNGGLAQYFVNTSGNLAREALAGLDAISAPHAASVMRRAMALFGPNGPSPERDARHDQLASLTSAQDDEMDALSDKFCRDEDRIDLQLLDFVRHHSQHFTESALSVDGACEEDSPENGVKPEV
jgi:HEAT repeat protein